MTRFSFTHPVARRTRRSSAQSTFRPQLERLEDRTVPSTVTNLLDSGPGSLRDAIANTPAGGVVDLQPGLTGTITLTSGELTISNDLTINGPGAGVLTVSGNHASGVFSIASWPTVTVAISGLTVADGSGTGIVNYGILSLVNIVATGNAYDGGAGGIYNGGIMTLSGSTVTDNTSSNASAGGSGGGGASRMAVT